jgi:hypothetical protein
MPATTTPTTRDRDPSPAGSLSRSLRLLNRDPPFMHFPYEHNPLANPIYAFNAWPPVQYVPPVPHRVWILDCKSCGTFLTNRGMKAVLLLHPNVSLYSTDALPINCSACSSNPDALRAPASRPRFGNRTCECLTQTLCCHGCGSAVGYMIVVPCNRCTGSMTGNNRATNGHRFIFHSNEVAGAERHYIPNEPGVVPYDPPQDLPVPPVFPVTYAQAPAHLEDTLFESSRADDESNNFRDSQQPYGRGSQHTEPALLALAEVKESCLPRKLKPGDLLFWHHLSRHGEIPAVADDLRARKQDWPRDFIST